jgi:hypothetical protein
MVAEEVEPGVFRVINDGVRDLASVDAVDLVAGYDGGIWLLQEDGFFRLGSNASHTWPVGRGPGDHVFEVAPDGTMWVIPRTVVGDLKAGHTYPDARRGEGRRSSDGEVWTVRSCPGGECRGVTLAPDGTLWANWPEGDEDHWRVGHLGPTGWQPLDGQARSAWRSDQATTTYTRYDRLFLTDAGDLYGAECWVGGCYLHRYEDGDWLGEDHYGIGYFNYGDVLDVGPDGTVWLEGSASGGLLSRYTLGEWVDWTAANFPDIGLDYQFEVAPDGSLWSSLWRSADGSDPVLAGWWERRAAVEDGRLVCDGLARFDGMTWSRFLPGQCISMDIAADGSVWVLADNETYVITPEAVAASE